MADERIKVEITPAFEYGYQLGQIKQAFTRMAEQMTKGFQAAMNPHIHLSAEEIYAIKERRAQAVYERRIAHERQVGLAFVRNEARRVRRELGLDPHDLAG